ncbi:hypothetical protein GCM10017752_05290 [Streptomyces roseoviridis]
MRTPERPGVGYPRALPQDECPLRRDSWPLPAAARLDGVAAHLVGVSRDGGPAVRGPPAAVTAKGRRAESRSFVVIAVAARTWPPARGLPARVPGPSSALPGPAPATRGPRPSPSGGRPPRMP